MGSGAKSYMRKGFLIYEEWLCTRSRWISLYMRKNFILFFISVLIIWSGTCRWRNCLVSCRPRPWPPCGGWVSRPSCPREPRRGRPPPWRPADGRSHQSRARSRDSPTRGEDSPGLRLCKNKIRFKGRVSHEFYSLLGRRYIYSLLNIVCIMAKKSCNYKIHWSLGGPDQTQTLKIFMETNDEKLITTKSLCLISMNIWYNRIVQI